MLQHQVGSDSSQRDSCTCCLLMIVMDLDHKAQSYSHENRNLCLTPRKEEKIYCSSKSGCHEKSHLHSTFFLENIKGSRNPTNT